MKKYFILAAAAFAFAACTNEDAIVVEQAAEQQVGEGTPVAFDGYVNRATTRAGQSGALTSANIQYDSYNFGVFGYYTNNSNYDDTATPNFMYNQHVTYAASSWVYQPVKYWPNEYGSSAESYETDKLTFFAYAPFVDVTAATGKVVGDQTSGITSLTKNTAAGDPLVKYIVNFDASKSVDLCWGTVHTDAASWARVQSGGNQALPAGLPWLNVERPAGATAQKVKFDFRHATSKLNVQIAYYADQETNASSEVINSTETKIYVRSINFTGFATKGALNLNNTTANTALWMAYNGIDDLETGESVTIYDGRKDGKEGVNGAVAPNEKITGLNSQIIQGDAATTGVTNVLQNLFTGADASTPIFVIPTGEEINVEIVYDVETKDASLAGFLSDGKTHGSTIENRIKKTVTFGSDDVFANGKAYVLKLYLGMNSVKFDADVTGWDDANDEGTADLPQN